MEKRCLKGESGVPEVDYYTLLGLPKQTHDLETIRKAYKAAKDMAQDLDVGMWEGLDDFFRIVACFFYET